MINRRQHKRIIISGSATLEFNKKGEIQSIQTLIANISLQGIGLYSYSSIKVETSVSITINFISLDGGLKTDSIKGRVINIRKIGNTHFLGIQFDEEIDAQNQPSLFKHLQNILPTD
ncbi:MAG: PilZ domain-containing protein [Thermodesulfovibrionales bacterium]